LLVQQMHSALQFVAVDAAGNTGRGYSAMNAAVLAALSEHADDGIIGPGFLSHPYATTAGDLLTCFSGGDRRILLPLQPKLICIERS
jgi:hypothetical protein